jgi:hypothetical protein
MVQIAMNKWLDVIRDKLGNWCNSWRLFLFSVNASYAGCAWIEMLEFNNQETLANLLPGKCSIT